MKYNKQKLSTKKKFQEKEIFRKYVLIYYKLKKKLSMMIQKKKIIRIKKVKKCIGDKNKNLTIKIM